MALQLYLGLLFGRSVSLKFSSGSIRVQLQPADSCSLHARWSEQARWSERDVRGGALGNGRQLNAFVAGRRGASRRSPARGAAATRDRHMCRCAGCGKKPTLLRATSGEAMASQGAARDEAAVRLVTTSDEKAAERSMSTESV